MGAARTEASTSTHPWSIPAISRYKLTAIFAIETKKAAERRKVCAKIHKTMRSNQFRDEATLHGPEGDVLGKAIG